MLCGECFRPLGRFTFVRQPDGDVRLFEPGVPVRHPGPERVYGGRAARPNPRVTEWRAPDGHVTYTWKCACGRSIPRRSDRLVALLGGSGEILI